VRDQFVAAQSDPVAFDDLAVAEAVEAIDGVPAVPGEQGDLFVGGLASGSSPTRSTGQISIHADPTSPSPPLLDFMNAT
jgi:hypothetical protein